MSKLSFLEPDTGYPGVHTCSVAAAMVGAAVVGGAVSADSSRRASNTQRDAASQAAAAQGGATADTNAMQMQMYRQNMLTNSPYLQSGQVAQAALMQGLGLGQLQAAPEHGALLQSQQNFDRGAYLAANPDVARSGMDPYQHYLEYGQGEGRPFTYLPNASDYSSQNYGASQAQLNQGANTLQAGQLNRAFAPSDLTTDPSYQFRLAQGQRSLEAGAAARGGLLTGQGAADIMNYGQGMASTEYQAAFQRNRETQGDLYNRLAALGNVGQIATGAAGGYTQNAANQYGQNVLQGQANQNAFLIGGANAGAAGSIGQGNAWGNALQGGLNNWTTLQGQQSTPRGYDYYPNSAAIEAGQVYGPPQTQQYPSESVFTNYSG